MKRAFLLALLAPSAALAGGYTLPVHGVRSLGMGGADLASSRGADALFAMPANLDWTEIGLDVAIIHLDATYTRASISAENLAGVIPNPTLGILYRFNDMLTFALGAYAPWAAQASFAEDGPQRYALVANDQTLVLYIHGAIAVRIGDFRFGGGVQNVVANIKQRVVLSAYTGLFGFAEDPELDVLSEVELFDPSTLTGNFSAAYDLGPVTLGVVYQLPFTVSGEGTFRQRLPSSVFFDNVTVEGETAEMAIPFPMALGAGISVRAHPRLTLDGAFRWEDWSVQQRLRITPTQMRLVGVPAIGEYKLGPAVIEKGMKDTFSAHAGGDFEVTPDLHARAGAFWESSAFSDRTFSVAHPDDDKLGVCLGVSYRFLWFRLDASIARVFQGERVVTTSELRQVNPTNPAQATTIGDGVYETGFWMGGLAFAWIPGDDADLAPASSTLDVSTGGL